MFHCKCTNKKGKRKKNANHVQQTWSVVKNTMITKLKAWWNSGPYQGQEIWTSFCTWQNRSMGPIWNYNQEVEEILVVVVATWFYQHMQG